MTVVVRAPRLELPDPTFAAWTQGSLLWLADRGMGYLPVPDSDVYGDDYWEKYELYAKTMMGRRLTVLRIEMVQRHIDWPGDKTLIDIGIGCGDFIERAIETWRTPVYGFDVNRRAVEWLTDRTLYRDPRGDSFHAATFFDSLEHVPDVYKILANVTDWVFCSLPIVPGDGPPAKGWKHLRQDEHCFYFTRDGLIGWMREQDWICVEHNTMESIAGREDIGSFAFRRAE
jgi:hypothetical protein